MHAHSFNKLVKYSKRDLIPLIKSFKLILFHTLGTPSLRPAGGL